MDTLPTPDVMFRDEPLYKVFNFDFKVEAIRLRAIEYYAGPLDAYCVHCQADSIFLRQINRLPMPGASEYGLYNHVFTCTLSCTRDRTHEFVATFLVHGTTLTKIGQYPSIADLSSASIKKYRKTLGKQAYGELNKAIGLYSHGIGIGAFVYLRRIFENLVEEAHQRAKNTPEWNEIKFSSSRMGDKIQMLRSYLPDFLVEHRVIYSILSKGLHELSEEECREYFGPVFVGIELILDEQVKEEEARQKIKSLGNAIQTITAKIGS